MDIKAVDPRHPWHDPVAPRNVLDIAPTVLETLGVPLPEWLEGRSLRLSEARAGSDLQTDRGCGSGQPGYVRAVAMPDPAPSPGGIASD